MPTQSTNSILVQKAGTNQAAVVKRILSVFDKATPADIEEGAQWYLKAGNFALECAKTYDFDVELVATVIAHLSPRIHWSRNKKNAESVLSGNPNAGILGMSLKGCTRAFNSDNPLSTLNGPKVKAFAANILGDQNQVTIDVWAARVALGPHADYVLLLGRKGVYDALADCYRIAASKRGVSAATMQATVWCVERGNAN